MRNGLNAATGEYEDLVKAGVIDAAKVTRSALQNAASIAALFLTTEAVVADKPEEKGAGGMPGGGMPDRAAWATSSRRNARFGRGALGAPRFVSDNPFRDPDEAICRSPWPSSAPVALGACGGGTDSSNDAQKVVTDERLGRQRRRHRGCARARGRVDRALPARRT